MWGSGWCSEGFVGLHCIVYLGRDEMAVVLLEEVPVEDFGAGMIDHLGRTPLAWAANSEHEGIVKLLQGCASAESGTGSNEVPMLPS